MQSVDYITGSEKVIETLGYWPTFHDAEVISFSAARALPFKNGFTLAHLAVYVRQYETIGEGTLQYAQVLCKSVLLHFNFNGACDFQFTDFNHQNVINAILVSRIDTNDTASVNVEIEPIWGFGGSLHCSSVTIESVEVLPNVEA